MENLEIWIKENWVHYDLLVEIKKNIEDEYKQPEYNWEKRIALSNRYQELMDEYCDMIKKYMKKNREYWYYMVWTHNGDIEKVKENINKLKDRSDKLEIKYMDISFEHGDLNGREHYNMRIKTSKPMPKNRLKYYEKNGKINYQPIHKKTEDNWNNIGNYCKKENNIEILIT